MVHLALLLGVVHQTHAGEKILSTLPRNTNQQSKFSALTATCEVNNCVIELASSPDVLTQTWDVSRIFLATLQLAADRNIDIVSSVPEGSVANNFDIHVRSHSRNYSFDSDDFQVLNLEARRPMRSPVAAEEDNFPEVEAQPAKSPYAQSRRKSIGGRLRFAAASPVVCDTYGADEYDRAYNQSPMSFEHSNSSGSLSLQSQSITSSPDPQMIKRRRGVQVALKSLTNTTQ